MIIYPSIPTLKKSSLALGEKVAAFYKFDGSNLRFEYSAKKGWHKFGTRHHLFDKSDLLYSQAVPLFQEIEDDILLKIKDKYKSIFKITAFVEFFGPSSFAGQHLLEEEKEIKLFDIHLHKHGLISPKDFIELFSQTTYAAHLIYQGPLNKSFINDVRQNNLNLSEGVVCKAESGQNCKIKTEEFLNRLKKHYQDNHKNIPEDNLFENCF